MTQQHDVATAHPGVDQVLAGLPPLMTIDEAATVLRVHRNTLHRWRRRGFGPAVHVLPGDKCYYQHDELQAWLRATCVCGRALAATDGTER